MALTFDDIRVDEILAFVNTRSDGRTSAQSTHTGRVAKITEKMVFLDDLTATQPGPDGERPVRYRIARAAWDTRQVTRVTDSGLPRRGKDNPSRVAAARIRPARVPVHTLVTVTTQGGPTRVHRAGCSDIHLDARRWNSTPQTHQVVDRAGLIRPMVEDLLAEDPTLDLDYYDCEDEFVFVACCPRLPWRANNAAFGYQIRHTEHIAVQKVVAALIADGHTPATVVGDYDIPGEQVQANGFIAFPRGADGVYIAHLHQGFDLAPGRAFHHKKLAAYARTLDDADGITVQGSPMRVLRTQVDPAPARSGQIGDCTVSYRPEQAAAPWTLTSASGERTYCPTDGLLAILTTEHGHPEPDVAALMAELSA